MAGKRRGPAQPVPNPTPDVLEVQIIAHERSVSARLDAIDEMMRRLEAHIEARARTHEVLVAEQLGTIQVQLGERDARFRERDKRVELTITYVKDLLAQADQSATRAAAKAEESFTKRLDAMEVMLDRQGHSQGQRIDDLKERVDKGGSSGFEEGTQRSRQNVMALSMAAIAALSLVATVVIAVIARL